MKKFVALIFSLLFIGCFCNADLAGYTINSYTTEYNLQKDGTLKVKEIIDVFFYEYRHGIYRDIPYKYNNNLSTPIKNVKVKGENFTTSKKGNNFQIKIGNKNKTIIGDHEYIIEYDIKRTVRTFSGWQELYRNLLGLEWNTSVNKFSFKLQLPEDVKISNDDFYVVYGPKGSQKKLNAHIKNNSIIIDSPVNIGANQAVTIGIKFPLNTFEGSILDKISDFIFGSYEKFQGTIFWKKIKPFVLIICGILRIIFTIILIILALFFLIMSHFTVTLEPKHLKMKRKNLKDIIHYTPPKGYSPIEIHLLYNRYPSTQIITTALYTRVSEGYMKINSEKRGFGSTGISLFEVIKEKEEFGKNERENFRRDLEEELWNCVKETKLDNYSLDTVKNIANRMFIFLRHEFVPKLYEKYENTEQIKIPGAFFGIGFILSFILCLSYLDHPSVDYKFVVFCFYVLWLIFGFLILYLPYYFRAWREYKKNKDEIYLNDKGKYVLEQIHGFRKFLITVEGERLSKLLEEDSKYCEKMLPYAIALGIGNKWIKKCRKFSDKFNIETLPSEVSTSTQGIADSIMMSGAISGINAIESSGGGSDWGSDSGFDSGGSSSGSSGGGGGGGGGGSW